MSRFPNHPGTIRKVDFFEGTTRDVPADEIPEDERFVYIKDGEEAAGEDDATERVPIVLVETISVDDRGRLVPREEASQIRVLEFGPDRRPLRASLRRPIQRAR